MGLRPGTQVDDFAVLRRLGAGGMAEVWLARDQRLGRKVALKLIRADVLATEADRARFLDEARATARFSHPHIVTLYGVGEVDGRAYLALEYLDGATLRERVGAAPREALRWCLAIADALAEAHAKGLVHRDLKPENVILAADGRLRVLDFGLARPAGGRLGADEARHIRGTPPYMAPELWLGHPPTPAADIWALGVLLYELITGQTPFLETDALALAERVTDPHLTVPRLHDDPPGVADLVARCLDPEPPRRPDAVELVDAIGELLGRSPLATSPFRGLHAFGEDDAALFFGRDAELTAFLERVRADAFLPIVGPSGAGKSSFVFAGVIPRLRERGPLAVIAMRPGRVPLATLAAQLRGHETPDTAFGATETALAAALRATPGLLAAELDRLAARRGRSVLLVVDQLEEVVTLTPDPEERRAFLEAVVGAADDPLTPVRVVATLREEFLGRVALTPDARRAFSRITVLRSPGPEALREIVVRPVEAVHHRYDDPTLPDAMVAAVVDEPAGLPLLQFAGQQLWLRRDRAARVLRRRDYEMIGGVGGALARHADGVLSAMGPAQVAHARQILLRLVTDEGTRQVLSRDEVLVGLDATAAAVLDALIDARLLVARDGETAEGDPGPAPVVVELVHESLARTWARLARWIDESRDDLAFLTEVRQAADVWRRRGRPADEVWSDEALQDALRRAEKLHTVPIDVREFLAAGTGRQRRLRRARRAFVAAAVVVTLAVIAVLAWQRSVAVDQRRIARSEQAEALRAQAEAALELERGLEARAALRAALEIEDDRVARAAWWRADRMPLLWERHLAGEQLNIAVMPDGAALVASRDHTASVLDVATGRPTRTLSMHPAAPFGHIAVTADQRSLFSYSHAPVYTRLDLTSSALEHLVWPDPAHPVRLEPYVGGFPIVEVQHEGRLGFEDASTGRFVGLIRGGRPGWLPGHPLVLAGLTGGELRIIDVDTGEVLFTRGLPEVVDRRCAIVSLTRAGVTIRCPDQELVAVPIGGAPTRAERFDGPVAEGLLTPTGHVVAASGDGALYIREPDGTRATPRLNVGRGAQLELDPDGRRVWTASQDGQLQAIDVVSGAVVWRVSDAEASFRGLAVGSGVVATRGASGTVRAWDPRTDASAHPAGGPGQTVRHVGFSADGTLVATAGMDAHLTVWDVATGRPRQRIRIGGDGARGLDLSPDGRWLASCHAYQHVRIWDASTGELTTSLELAGRRVQFSPDSTRLAVLLRRGGAEIRAVPDGALLAELEAGPDPNTYWSAWSPDGRWLAMTSRGHWAGLWDTHTGALVHEWPEGHDYGFWQVSFLPDGSVLVDDQARGWRCDPVRGTCEALDGPPEATWWAGGPASAARVALDDAGLIRWDVDTGAIERRALAVSPGPPPMVFPDRRGELVALSAPEPYFRLYRTADLRPVWGTWAVLHDGQRVRSHRGWEPDRPAPSAWRTAMETDTRFATQVSGGPGCRWTWDDRVELWDPAGDTRLRVEDAPALTRLVAHPDGCALLHAAGTLSWLGVDGSRRTLASEVAHVAVSGEALVVGHADEVCLLDTRGQVRERIPAAATTTAARCGEALCVGGRGGRIRLLDGDEVELAHTPDAQVMTVAAGPAGTVVAGFGNGEVGVWEAETGTRLLTTHLHGPVEHVVVQAGVIAAATAAGDVARLDLGVLEKDWCTLLREVWERVPSVPSDEGLVRRDPPADHPCRSP